MTTLRKIVLDTNLYIDWLNDGAHQPLFLGPGFVRYLSAIVHMELRMGATTAAAHRALDKIVRAYQVTGRTIVLDGPSFDLAGRTLRELRVRGREVRRSSLVNDVLIALSARAAGATLMTADADYKAIREVLEFKLELVSR